MDTPKTPEEAVNRLAPDPGPSSRGRVAGAVVLPLDRRAVVGDAKAPRRCRGRGRSRLSIFGAADHQAARDHGVRRGARRALGDHDRRRRPEGLSADRSRPDPRLGIYGIRSFVRPWSRDGKCGATHHQSSCRREIDERCTHALGPVQHRLDGTLPGQTPDDSIHGGGAYPDEHRHGFEVENFLPIGGWYYGHGEPPTRSGVINLERIDPGAGDGAEYLDGVTVVFVATRRPEGGRVVVGWYRNARVRREGKRRPDPGHDWYFAKARTEDCTLLGIDARTFKVPQARKGVFGMGRTDIRYTLREDGEYDHHAEELVRELQKVTTLTRIRRLARRG